MPLPMELTLDHSSKDAASPAMPKLIEFLCGYITPVDADESVRLATSSTYVEHMVQASRDGENEKFNKVSSGLFNKLNRPQDQIEFIFELVAACRKDFANSGDDDRYFNDLVARVGVVEDFGADDFNWLMRGLFSAADIFKSVETPPADDVGEDGQSEVFSLLDVLTNAPKGAVFLMNKKTESCEKCKERQSGEEEMVTELHGRLKTAQEEVHALNKRLTEVEATNKALETKYANQAVLLRNILKESSDPTPDSLTDQSDHEDQSTWVKMVNGKTSTV